ncbi:putative ABC transporter permease [Oscillospiraceae bacterium MB08-C2-2]|nr:putative ABC transporter permease [Oscillospiraceae bacterium MB08-C2-2]
MEFSFSQLVLYLAAYSVIGWICETIYCSVGQRKFINRGFLNGPYCPIYGVGGVIILAVTQPFAPWPPLVFAAAMVAASILEYFTSWLMEEMFQIRWWDYSHMRFNLRGRICLLNSLLFGGMGLAAVYLLHPLASGLIGKIPSDIQRVVASLVVVVFLWDLLVTLNGLLGLSQSMKKLREYFAGLELHDISHTWYNRRDLAASVAQLYKLLQKEPENKTLAKIQGQLEDLIGWGHIQSRRFVNAFPYMTVSGLGRTAESLRQSWEHHKEKTAAGGGLRRILRRKARQGASVFTRELNVYRLTWVFVVACVLGYFIETVYCLVTTGVIESRQGMLYGPFNQVYGFGAVLMAVLLTPLAKKNDRWVFMGSALIGGAFEYLCSWLQEKMFGAVSWDYSSHHLSIGGRTSITFMFFWGILGLVFIKAIYPRLSHVIDRIPKRQGRVMISILAVALSINMLLSGLAVYRWTERLYGQPADTWLGHFLDRQYPDSMLEEVYPNMSRVEIE